jgi:hypothetical protein
MYTKQRYTSLNGYLSMKGPIKSLVIALVINPSDPQNVKKESLNLKFYPNDLNDSIT